MSKSKILMDRLAKLIEEGLVTSKDISEEAINSLKINKDNIFSKLNLITRDEFEIQKARLDKIQKEFNKIKNKIKQKKINTSTKRNIILMTSQLYILKLINFFI